MLVKGRTPYIEGGDVNQVFLLDTAGMCVTLI